MTQEWTVGESVPASEVPPAGPQNTEPSEFTLLRETIGKTADAIEAVRDKWIDAAQQIPVPEPPLIAGRPIRNPFTWVLGGLIATCREDMLQEVIDLLRLEGSTSYSAVIEEMFASGDPPWPEEYETS